MKIIFVCTGNICRSPLAEGILRTKISAEHLPVTVDSCGFETFHIGQPPDPRAQSVAIKHGIDISSHTARLFSVDDFDEFDLIFVMDNSHFQQVMNLARNESDRNKVDFILNMVFPFSNRNVEDPWYHDLSAFEKAYLQLDQACDAIVQLIKNQNPNR